MKSERRSLGTSLASSSVSRLKSPNSLQTPYNSKSQKSQKCKSLKPKHDSIRGNRPPMKINLEYDSNSSDIDTISISSGSPQKGRGKKSSFNGVLRPRGQAWTPCEGTSSSSEVSPDRKSLLKAKDRVKAPMKPKDKKPKSGSMGSSDRGFPSLPKNCTSPEDKVCWILQVS